MTSILSITQSQLEIFLLSLFRTSGVLAVAPIFSQRSIPMQLKIGFAMLMAILTFPFVQNEAFVSPDGLLGLLGIGATEFLMGAMIGFIFYLLFVSVQFAGGIVGFQIGFAIVNVIDPTTSQNISIIGQFQGMIATLLFFIMDGHHMILSAMIDSFKLIPMGTVAFQFSNADALIRFSAGTFILAVKIASPVMLAIFLTDCALGIVARTVPQMNIFIVGFPIKIMFGLLIVALTLPVLAVVFQNAVLRLDENLSSLLVSLAR